MTPTKTKFELKLGMATHRPEHVAPALEQPHDDAAHGGLVVHDEDGRSRVSGAGVRIDVGGQVGMQHGSPVVALQDGSSTNMAHPGRSARRRRARREIVARSRALLHL